MENNIFYANLMSIVYRLHFNDKKDPIHKQYLVKLNLSVGCPMDPLYIKFIVHWLYCGRWSSIIVFSGLQLQLFVQCILNQIGMAS